MSSLPANGDTTDPDESGGAACDRSAWPTRVIRLSDEEDDADVLALSPAERIQMMWPLAVNAWAFMGVDVSGLQFQRHIARLVGRFDH